MDDFPEAGRPVIHTAKPSWVLRSTITVHLGRIKTLVLQHSQYEGQQFSADFIGQRRVPHRAGDYQPAKGVKRGNHTKHLAISGLFQVTFPETQKQSCQISLQASPALLGKKEIIQREAGHIIGRVAILASRAVEEPKVHSGSKQNIPGMEIPVDLAQPVCQSLQPPPPPDR